MVKKLEDFESVVIPNHFGYHKPKSEEVKQRHLSVRQACAQAARVIGQKVERSHERDKALSALREAMFWANAGIACESGEPGEL